jgi:hypothetical protein
MPTRRKGDSEPAEFLVFDIGTGARVGGSYSLLGVANSQKKAEELIKGLPSSSATKVAILERKAVLSRKPAVELSPSSERIVPDRT